MIVTRESADLSLLIVAVVPIRIVGDPVLHTATSPVPVGSDGSLPAELVDLITNLYDTMDAANGVGLAANQIGVSQRVFVYDCADERGRTTRRRGVVVNPVLETSEVPETMPDPDDDDEGCLSVPGESFPTRPGQLGAGHGSGRRRQPGRAGGQRTVRADAAARDGSPGRVSLRRRLIGGMRGPPSASVKSHGWGVPGLAWMPGEDPDPFGH